MTHFQSKVDAYNAIHQITTIEEYDNFIQQLDETHEDYKAKGVHEMCLSGFMFCDVYEMKQYAQSVLKVLQLKTDGFVECAGCDAVIEKVEDEQFCEVCLFMGKKNIARLVEKEIPF